MSQSDPFVSVTTVDDILLASVVLRGLSKVGNTVVDELQDSGIDALLRFDLRSRVACKALTERNISVEVGQNTPVDGSQKLSHTEQVVLALVDTTG